MAKSVGKMICRRNGAASTDALDSTVSASALKPTTQPEKRELLIVNMISGEVVKRVDVTGRDRFAIADAAAKLHAQINPEEFYISDTGAATFTIEDFGPEEKKRA